MQPKRIQRRRTKGWRMPKNTLYVGRGSKWGNPFVVCSYRTAEQAVDEYKKSIAKFDDCKEYIQRELKGKNLACWCPLDSPCHADILLDIANS